MQPASKRQKHDPPPPPQSATIPSQSSVSGAKEVGRKSTKEKISKKQKKRQTVSVEASKKTTGAKEISLVESIQAAGEVTGKKSSSKAKSKEEFTRITQLSSDDDRMEVTDGGLQEDSAPSKSAGEEMTLLQVSKVTSSADEVEGRRFGRDHMETAGVVAVKRVKSIYAGFEVSKVIRMERTVQPRLGSIFLSC